MTALADEVVVKLSAEISGFNKGMEKSAAALGRLEDKVNKSMAGISSALKNALSGAALLGAGAAFLRMGADAERAALGLKTLSTTTGVSMGALQEWRYAATQAGASGDDLDGVVRDLDKSIGMARSGSEELAKVFRALGLEDLIKNGASTEEVFLSLADALKKVQDPAQADAIALKLMGGNAEKLTGLIRQGSGAFAEYGRELERVGGKIDDNVNESLVQAAKETAKLEVQFNKFVASAWSGTQRVILGLKFMIEDLGTAIDKAAGLDFLRDNVKGTEGYYSDNTWAPGMGPNKPLEKVRITPAPIDRNKLDSLLSPSGGSGNAGRNQAAETMKRMREENERLVESLKFELDLMGMADVEQRVQIALRGLNADATQAQITATEAYARAIFENQEQQRALAELESFAAQIKQQYGDETEKLAEYQRQLNAAHAQGLITLQEYQKALADATQSDDMSEMDAEWKRIGDQAKEGLADALVDIISGTKDAAEAFKELAAQIGVAIAKMLILKAIEAGVNAAFGFTGGMALGGQVNAGNRYLVGESGPELFVPQVSGQIVPNNRLGGGGSFAFNYSINAPGADSGTLAKMELMLQRQKQDIFQMMPKFVDDRRARSKMLR